MRKSTVALACLALGCNVPEPPGSTGGTDAEAGACGRGFVVVSSDYQSSNVSLVGIEGDVLSSSFISSATSDTNLSASLSADVVLPSMPMMGADVVLLDRALDISVLTWVDVRSANVTGQLPAATDYAANPHDFIEIAPDKAYVTRYDPASGDADVGSDVLIVDPAARRAISRIDLSSAMSGEDPKFFARPSRGAKLGDRVVVMLEAYSIDIDPACGCWGSAPSRIVAIDPVTDTILEHRVLDGLHGCAGFAPSPDGRRVAVSCLGRYVAGSDANVAESGIVVLDAGPGFEELERFDAAEIAGAPLGFGLAWASDDLLLFATSGSLDDKRPDKIIELSIATGAHREVLRSKELAFVLGDVSCAAECGVCFATDAEHNALQGFRVDAAAGVGSPQPVVVDTAIGLPPRALGRF